MEKQEMKKDVAIRIAKDADLKELRRDLEELQWLFGDRSDKSICAWYRLYLTAYETLAELPEDDFLQYCTDGFMDCLQFLSSYLAYAYCKLMDYLQV